jgi:hypothetical protein
MILPLNLNRRHKVALFFTLALAGIAALNGAKMMQVVGILLLGLALAWAFGSDSRVVHWLFLSLGLLLTCLTVGGAWYIRQSDTNLYAQKVAAFEQRIPELAKKYPLRKVRPSGMDRPSREWDEKGNPVQTNGQIILDKDLEPYLVKNPKASSPQPQIDPTTGERIAAPRPPQQADKWAQYADPPGWRPVTPSPQTKSSGVTLDFSKAQPLADSNKPKPVEGTFRPLDLSAGDQPPNASTGTAAPATLPADFFSKPPGELFQLTMPDDHVRYFAYKRDADNCQDGFFEQKTQKMWNEAWVRSLCVHHHRRCFQRTAGLPPENPVGSNIRTIYRGSRRRHLAGCGVWRDPLRFGLGSNPRNPRQTASHLTTRDCSTTGTMSAASLFGRLALVIDPSARTCARS